MAALFISFLEDFSWLAVSVFCLSNLQKVKTQEDGEIYISLQHPSFIAPSSQGPCKHGDEEGR